MRNSYSEAVLAQFQQTEKLGEGRGFLKGIFTDCHFVRMYREPFLSYARGSSRLREKSRDRQVMETHFGGQYSDRVVIE